MRDLLSELGDALPKVRLGSPESYVELVQEKVDNPLDFSRVLKAAFQSRGNDASKFNVSHLYGLHSVPSKSDGCVSHMFYNDVCLIRVSKSFNIVFNSKINTFDLKKPYSLNY